MPAFDVVSEIDKHELDNAIDQANREIANRFDFKGSNAKIEQKDNVLILIAPAEFQIKQISDLLQTRMAKRQIDIKCLEYGKMEESNNECRQQVIVRQGIDKGLSRRIVKLVKDSKLKVQAAVQGEQIRISGKKRDDLQDIIAMLKEKNLELPLQYSNFRD